METYFYSHIDQLPQHQKDLILTLHEYIIINISDSDLRISDLASCSGLSERQLYRKLKEILGITPNVLITKIRMNVARQLLERGQYATVAEISFAVGYKSPDYFSCKYAEWFSKRPIEYL